MFVTVFQLVDEFNFMVFGEVHCRFLWTSYFTALLLFCTYIITCRLWLISAAIAEINQRRHVMILDFLNMYNTVCIIFDYMNSCLY